MPLCFFIPALQAEAIRLLVQSGDRSAAMDNLEDDGHVVLVRVCAGDRPGMLALKPRISKGATQQHMHCKGRPTLLYPCVMMLTLEYRKSIRCGLGDDGALQCADLAPENACKPALQIELLLNRYSFGEYPCMSFLDLSLAYIYQYHHAAFLGHSMLAEGLSIGSMP